MTSGMGGGASSTARLSAIQMQQQGRLGDIQTCGDNGQLYGPNHAMATGTCIPSLTIAPSGSVGVGTASPSRQLDVAGNAKINTLRVGEVGHGTGWPGISNNVLGGVGGQYAIIQNASGETLINATATQRIGFRINNTQHMTLSSAGNFGIGTETPAFKLDVAGEIKSSSANAFRLWQPTISSFFRNDNSDTYFLLTNSGDPNGTWNSLRPLRINNTTGNVFIGTSLAVTNNATANAFFYSSDRTLKDNIQPIDDGLLLLEQLRPVRFDWKKDGTPSLGFIAQDVEKVLPEAVNTNDSGIKAVDYGKLTAPLVAAVKEQQKEIAALKAAIAALEKKIK